MRFRLITLFALVLIGALASLFLRHYIYAPEVSESIYKNIDGSFSRAEYIDVDPQKKDRIYFRYGPISDSGVELERVVNGKTIWLFHTESLMVAHSQYRHEVHVSIENNEVHVHSIGSQGQFTERRNFQTGRLIKRQVNPPQPPTKN